MCLHCCTECCWYCDDLCGELELTSLSPSGSNNSSSKCLFRCFLRSNGNRWFITVWCDLMGSAALWNMSKLSWVHVCSRLWEHWSLWTIRCCRVSCIIKPVNVSESVVETNVNSVVRLWSRFMFYCFFFGWLFVSHQLIDGSSPCLLPLLWIQDKKRKTGFSLWCVSVRRAERGWDHLRIISCCWGCKTKPQDTLQLTGFDQLSELHVAVNLLHSSQAVVGKVQSSRSDVQLMFLLLVSVGSQDQSGSSLRLVMFSDSDQKRYLSPWGSEDGCTERLQHVALVSHWLQFDISEDTFPGNVAQCWRIISHCD